MRQGSGASNLSSSVLFGFLMLLRFYPDWLNSLVSLAPFPHMLVTVININLGTVGPGEVFQRNFCRPYGRSV